jgi:hypothetical protein
MNIIKMICIGFMLTAFSATAFAIPQECNNDEGVEVYNKGYDMRALQLYNDWTNYGCDRLEDFISIAHGFPPMGPTTKPGCKAAGIRDAGLQIAERKQEECGVDYRGEDRFPNRLIELINNLKESPVTNPPSTVIQYKYNGNTVYYLPPACCDIMGELYDVDGILLCHPDGGMTGQGDGYCPDFFSTRTNEVMIWEDYRS